MSASKRGAVFSGRWTVTAPGDRWCLDIAAGIMATMRTLRQLMILLVAMPGCGESQRETSPTGADAPLPATATASVAAPVPTFYDVGGLKLRVELLPDKPRFMVSDPTYASMVFSGDGIEMQAELRESNDRARPENYRLVFIDAKGTTLPVPDVKDGAGSAGWPVELKPGSDQRTKLVLANWVVGLVPGPYTLRAETVVKARKLASTSWQEVAIMAEAAVEVIPDDPVAIGHILDEIGAVALAPSVKSGDAQKQLLVVRDPRVVPILLRLVEKPDFAAKNRALLALATWNDDRALAAIVGVGRAGFKTGPDGVGLAPPHDIDAEMLRHTAAEALARSPHSGALDALFVMRDDPAQAVRSAVARAMAKLGEPERSARLNVLKNDKDPLVRQWVENALAGSE